MADRRTPLARAVANAPPFRERAMLKALEAVGLNWRWVYGCRDGTRTPAPWIQRLIAQHLQVPVAELFPPRADESDRGYRRAS